MAFILQETLGSGNKITVPIEVREALFTDPKDTDNIFIWNHDKKQTVGIISNSMLIEPQSEFKDSSTDLNSHGRTTIPRKIRDILDIKEGDHLYFVTPEVALDGRPTAFVYSFEQMEQLVLSGSEESKIQPNRNPQF